jgi:hypothetical protein
MKPLWKVRTVYVDIIGARILMRAYKPHAEERVYRWRWRARWAAFCANFPAPGSPVIAFATVKPYWPNSNVVPLRAATF